MKEAVRHHYIPQFILRSFCGDNGCLSYFDISQRVYELQQRMEKLRISVVKKYRNKK